MTTAHAAPGWRIAVNLIAFQAGWFASVLGAAQGRPGLGIATVAAAVGLHLALSPRRAADALIIALAVVAGVVMEMALLSTGWYAYVSPGPLAGVPPAWILGLWALFATTLRESLRWLHGRPALAVLFGAIGGPLSFLGGARLGGAELLQPLPALLALGLGWGLVTPLLVQGAARLDAARRA